MNEFLGVCPDCGYSWSICGCEPTYTLDQIRAALTPEALAKIEQDAAEHDGTEFGMDEAMRRAILKVITEATP